MAVNFVLVDQRQPAIAATLPTCWHTTRQAPAKVEDAGANEVSCDKCMFRVVNPKILDSFLLAYMCKTLQNCFPFIVPSRVANSESLGCIFPLTGSYRGQDANIEAAHISKLQIKICKCISMLKQINFSFCCCLKRSSSLVISQQVVPHQFMPIWLWRISRQGVRRSTCAGQHPDTQGNVGFTIHVTVIKYKNWSIVLDMWNLYYRPTS